MKKHMVNFVLLVIMFVSVANGASLTHYWQLDDSIGASSALDAITDDLSDVVCTIDFQEPGRDGRSAYFYSDCARVELGNVAPGDDSFTITFYFMMKKFNGLNSDQDHILSANQGQDGRWAINLWGDGSYLTSTGGKPKLNFWQNTYGGADLTATVDSDRWYHVAITRDMNLTSDNFKLYLDGVLIHTGTNLNAFTQGSNGVWLGRRPNYQSAFDGWIDDVKLFDDALTVDEIGDLLIHDHYWSLDDEFGAVTARDKITDNFAAVEPADPNKLDFEHPGVDGYSAYFFDDYVRINLGEVAPQDSSFSMAFFFKMREFNSINNDQDHILSAHQSQDGRWSVSLWGDQTYLDSTGGKPKLLFWQNTYGGADLTATVDSDRWYHVVLTRDADLTSNNFKIYLDGVLVHTGTNTGTFTQGENGVWLGRRPNYQSGFDGWIDEVRFFNECLTASEIYDLATPLQLLESPVCDSTFIDPSQVHLRWELCNPIVPVDKYRVYFSDSLWAVQSRLTSSYKGEISATATLAYNVGNLSYDDDYYWCIDTVLDDFSVVSGNIWEFATEPVEVPGVVIAHSYGSTGIYYGSPCIVVLPNGDYVATYDEFGPNSTESDPSLKAKSHVFSSSDQGCTWKYLSTIDSMWGSLFVHDGFLYHIGCDYHPGGDTVIRRSTNNGWSWTYPVSSNWGLLSTLQLSNAPTTTISHGGRIWLSMTDALGSGSASILGSTNRIFLMSFDEDDNPLAASNWSYTQNIDFDEVNWFSGGWLESIAAVSPDGHLVALPRVYDPSVPEKSAIIDYGTDGSSLIFSSSTDFTDFYGGCKKFTVRYDSTSDLYWALSNPAFNEDYDVEKTRNALAIMSSSDMINWITHKVLLFDSDYYHTGFQYPYFVVEGDDILSVIRAAYADGTDRSDISQHNSNYMIFYRIENFRDVRDADLVQHWKLDETVKNFSGTGSITNMPLTNEISGGSQAYITTPEDQQNMVLLGQTGAVSGTSIALNSRYDRIRLGDVAPDPELPDSDKPWANPFTIAFWFKTSAINNYDGGPDTIMSTNTGQTGRWAIDLTGATDQTTDIDINFFHAGGATVTFTDAIDAGQWYHVAMTRSLSTSNNYRIYLDGVLQSTLTDIVAFTNSSDGVWVGRRPAVGTRGFNGAIDDIRIYNNSLTNDEVWNLSHP